MKYIIIQGSSRSHGNSSLIAGILEEHLDADIINLCSLHIHSFSYDHKHMDDDFLSTFKKILDYDVIIFVTPVYWYAMSGLMKNFFDRITDCLIIEKELGRQLRGKAMATVACGSDDIQTDGFFEPFKLSAAYLGMAYLGSLHTYIDDEGLLMSTKSNILNFIQRIEDQA